MHSLMMLAAQEGLLESTDNPLTLTLVGMGLLVLALMIYFVTNLVAKDDGSFIGMILSFASIILAVAGILALFTGLFGE